MQMLHKLFCNLLDALVHDGQQPKASGEDEQRLGRFEARDGTQAKRGLQVRRPTQYFAAPPCKQVDTQAMPRRFNSSSKRCASELNIGQASLRHHRVALIQVP